MKWKVVINRRVGHANPAALQYLMRHAQPVLQCKRHKIEV